MGESRWIDLDGAANVRDMGGLPTDDGRVTARDRLIRADNLQGLSDRDVRTLVDDHHVRAVADLRTGVEVTSEGPGPMTHEPLVDVEHYSLFPEAGHNTDVAAVEGDGPVVLPWQKIPSEGAEAPKSAADFYLRYLLDRPDSIIDTLRLIASTDGATIVHCAAGKDRTGVVVAIALAEIGVRREDIIDDYALSAERIHEIFDRLRASDTYADDLAGSSVDKHAPRDTTMRELLGAIDSAHGGVPAWLRKHGWTDEDATALRKHLLD
ncbi:MAG TPA: tyrosine-protein phosphatase [Jatrophihabitantaceae bacterium]|nr:tyrosine-protein phosphatase [Jatrophihabitantaceae bacterium]